MMATFVTCALPPVSIPPAFGKRQDYRLRLKISTFCALSTPYWVDGALDGYGPVDHYVFAVCSGEER